MSYKAKWNQLHDVHQDFYEFLEDRGLMRRFSANIEKSNVQTWKLLHELLFRSKRVVMRGTYATQVDPTNGLRYLDAKSLVSSMFMWNETIQGHGFWSDVNEKWVDYYEENKFRY